MKFIKQVNLQQPRINESIANHSTNYEYMVKHSLFIWVQRSNKHICHILIAITCQSGQNQQTAQPSMIVFLFALRATNHCRWNHFPIFCLSAYFFFLISYTHRRALYFWNFSLFPITYYLLQSSTNSFRIHDYYTSIANA